MILHIVSSMRKFDKDLPFVQAIIDTAEGQGHTFALNWFDVAKAKRKTNTETALALDWKHQFDENMDAMLRCDAVIVEGSRFNFSQGYQTAFALLHKKPVLNLYRKDQDEYQQWPDKNFVAGVTSPLFTSKDYLTTDDVRRIVTQFLKTAAPTQEELDVKFMLDIDIHKKLDKLSRQTGKSKASLVKDTLTRSFQESDMESLDT